MKPSVRGRRTLAARLLLLAGLALSPMASHAQTPAEAETEKAKIASERAAAEARYSARERECRERFVVTSCVEDAQKQRRATLDALRARQLRLDETRRRTRAAERRAEIAAKVAEDAKRAQEGRERATRAQAEPPREPRPVREPREARPPRQAREARPPTAGAKARAPRAEDAVERRAREARSRSEFEARRRKAEEHRASTLERTVRRMKERNPAAPLPVPSASAIRGSAASAP